MFCVSTDGIKPELSTPDSGLIFNSGTMENTYFYWGYIRTGGLSLRWYRDNICDKEGDGEYYDLLSEKAKDAIDWCSKYNILPPDIISDMDDQKILLCIGLYNTVKFLAEHI